MPNLLIYIPTFARPMDAEKQARTLSEQASIINSLNKNWNFQIRINVNADSRYKQNNFVLPFCIYSMNLYNIGADANIAHGFFLAKSEQFDYLWIVGDDEDIPKEALRTIISSLDKCPEVDALIGAKGLTGVIRVQESLLRFNEECGRTLSFISSVIYKVSYSYEMCELALQFAYTSYSHLAMQHLLIDRGFWKRVLTIDIQDICDYHKKVMADPLKPRSEYGVRDSRVFFGKPLSALASRNRVYIRQEFTFWWREHWHRVSMYLDRQEPNGWAFLGYSFTYVTTMVWFSIALFPYWRIKEKLRPIIYVRDRNIP